MHPPGGVRCSRPESNRLQVPRGKKDSPQTESAHKMGAQGKEQRDSEQEGTANGMCMIEMLSRDGTKSPPRQGSGGSGGKSTAVADAVRCTSPVARWNRSWDDPGRKPLQNLFLATDGSDEAGTTLL